jgi:HEAT repeat protein
MLQGVGVPTSDTDLLQFLRERSRADDDLLRMAKLVQDLGAEEFELREAATRKLTRLGPPARPGLRRAAASSTDIEVKQRAAACLRSIDKATPAGAPLAVARLLARRKPTGTLPALLAYLPYAADSEVEETIYYAVDDLSVREGRLAPALLAALADRLPARRAVAGCVVGRAGTAEQRKLVYKLLEDPSSEVRLRSAQGLLAGRDLRGLPTLVGLLADPSKGVAWQAEELLHYVAGDAAPRAVVGKGTGPEKLRCRAAWQAWLKAAAATVDLKAVERTNRRPGLVLTFEDREIHPWNTYREPEEEERRLARPWAGQVWLCGCEGPPRCQPYSYAEFAREHLPVERDTRSIGYSAGIQMCWRLKLATEYPRSRWERHAEPTGSEYIGRLGNGNRLIGDEDATLPRTRRIIEVDRRGRVVWVTAAEGMQVGLVVWPLVRVGFPRAEEHVVDLDSLRGRAPRVRHPDVYIRRTTAAWLAAAPPGAGVSEAAVRALADEDMFVRLQAMEALQKASAVPGSAVKHLVKEFQRPLPEVGEKHRTVADAGSLLVRIGAGAVPELVEAFDKAKGAPGARTRTECAFVLAQLLRSRDPRAWRVVRSALDDEDPNVRKCCAWGMCRRQEPTLIPEMARLLRNKDPEVAKTVASVMGFLKEAGRPAIPYLLEALKQKHTQHYAAASLTSVGRGDPKVLTALIGLYDPRGDFDSCTSAVAVLAMYEECEESKMIVPVLRRALQDKRRCPETKQPKIHEFAISALRRMGKHARPALPELIALVNQQEGGWDECSTDLRNAIEAIDPKQARALAVKARREKAERERKQQLEQRKNRGTEEE